MVSRSDYGGREVACEFASIDHVGLRWAADFLEIADREERDIVIRRAYEKTVGFLDLLGIEEWPD